MDNTIIIPAIDKVSIEHTDRVYNLIEHLCEVKKLLKYNKTCSVGKLVDEALKECDKSIDILDSAISDRLNTWQGLLNKYYKMTMYKKTNYGEYTNISYIYPYQIVLSNETLWMLEVNPSDDYKGGVNDKSYTLDSNFDYDVTLEEITEADFTKEAVKSTMHVIERRLKREKDKKNGKIPSYELVKENIQ